MTQHRSGWYQGIVGNPSQPSRVHWFDNDEGMSVCGTMPWRKPMVFASVRPIAEHNVCQICRRMLATTTRVEGA